MTFQPHLRSELAAATSVLDLAHRLGIVCVENGRLLMRRMARPEARACANKLERTVASLGAAPFEAPDPQNGFAHVLALNDLDDCLADAEADHPLEYLAFLRGLCRVALFDYFRVTGDRILLERGMPFFVPTRPIHEDDDFGAHTPSQETLGRGKLLEGLPFRLFKHQSENPIDVELDYRERDGLNKLTWEGTERLPRVATVHPWLGPDGIAYPPPDRENGSFFDVRPRSWDLRAVLALLSKVRHEAEIAVLPELSVPSDAVAALGAALAASPDSYPPLVIAGSAHVRAPDPSGAGEVRANESRIYLKGRRIATYAKIHAFATRQLGTTADGEPLTEAITPGPKTITVLCDDHTHLAVVICSDLNDDEIPALLEMAKVNLLLVPSLTFAVGSFAGAAGRIASYCQGVAVIVNADVDPLVKGWRRRVFRTMAAVPRPEAAHQTRSFPRRLGRRRALGVLDPNRPLRRAVRWL